ncbi:2-oxo-4-hydroxy-4-carboxy-5-ureidoimidazoline decarboxylase [Arenibaculum pallidiluteum]|uniref:2-oxo-4-hydroxy-4-carboxy-5-ureidoimidazoline decarboxylase n=1 Tax=Arenibaculum pallidiluteum TaxID=2812559 RepID=UPI001A96FDA0|nr:2-oxo-4-hydroxy-4-carboxy-5-ureidoimidazoline decarboxylase [Arenibaculum pallidiluteum]
MSQQPLAMAAVNALGRDAFVAAFGQVFEHAPWIAAEAWEARPFADPDALHGAMMAAIERASPERRLALLRSHPELAGEAMRQRLLTAASTDEQRGAGLTALGPEDGARFDALNAAYRERFGFPFIIAVREHTKDSILDAFARRLAAEPAEEIRTALGQVARIARHRIAAMITG